MGVVKNDSKAKDKLYAIAQYSNAHNLLPCTKEFYDISAKYEKYQESKIIVFWKFKSKL